MSALRGALARLFDRVLEPLDAASPVVGLTAVALATTVLALLVFRAAANQAKLRAVRRSMTACLFEVRLWPDDVRAVLRALAEIVLLNGKYLLLSAPAIACLAVPMALLFGQLEMRYGYRALHPDERFIVRATVRGPVNGARRPPARLDVPEGLSAETPAIWIPSAQELDWRVRAVRPGDYALTVTVGGEAVTQSVRVVADAAPSAPLQAGAVESVAIRYPRRSIRLFGARLPWIAVFLGASVIVTLVLRRRLRVAV